MNNIITEVADKELSNQGQKEVKSLTDRIIEFIKRLFDNRLYKTAARADQFLQLLSKTGVNGQSLRQWTGDGIIGPILKGMEHFTNLVMRVAYVECVFSCLCLMKTLLNNCEKCSSFGDMLRNVYKNAAANTSDILKTAISVLTTFFTPFKGASAHIINIVSSILSDYY